jgi:hypothetical protein
VAKSGDGWLNWEWVAKLGDGWLSRGTVGKVGGWVDKMVSLLLATASLWVRIQTSPQNCKRVTKQRSGQHKIARKKYSKISASP